MSSPIPLEDQLQDVVGKARRGLRLTDSQLAQKAGIPLETVEALQDGKADPDAVAKIAGALELDPTALLALGRGDWHPAEAKAPATFAMFNTAYHDMMVNAYLIWEEDGGPAVAFDTGGDCKEMLAAIEKHHLKVEAILLTHTHVDHVMKIDDLVNRTGAPVYVSEFEKLADTIRIADGKEFTVGNLKITARLTAGHSPGGLTYVVEGLQPTIAVVGDALFSSSMGGVPPENYVNALSANREKIFSLPDDTIICPGHGPLTTVAEEKKHNSFYAGKV